ncbi:Inorganic pyrophosphatase [Gossypium arboreum]|uniref:Inorganic pyrophosphatase n=1 Tax=Gossypium arboreum TaxID=29729 RepID=A0A0B0PR39_GOSAR|nr:Inorganic pyrophosphatase [Gossypium arboreum]
MSSVGLSSHHPLHYPLNTRNTISATYRYIARVTSYHVMLAMELLTGLLIKAIGQGVTIRVAHKSCQVSDHSRIT